MIEVYEAFPRGADRKSKVSIIITYDGLKSWVDRPDYANNRIGYNNPIEPSPIRSLPEAMLCLKKMGSH
jgi:hypothetical protein